MRYPSNSPMLAMSQKIPFEELRYPTLASVKMDGLRCLIYDGQLFTRNLKLHPNQKLQEYFKEAMRKSKKDELVFDGELWDETLPFCETAGICRSFTAEIGENLAFHVFDMLPLRVYDHGAGGNPLRDRRDAYYEECAGLANVRCVAQMPIHDAETLKGMFEQYVQRGHEGLICRDPRSYYKHGRCQPTKPFMVKFKATETHDAQIIGIKPARKLKEGVARTSDLMGHLKRVHTQDSYEADDKLGSFQVAWNELEFSVGPGRGLDDHEKRKIWKNKEAYIGKWIEFESLSVGVKDVPRMGKFVKFRFDKED